MLDGDEVDMKFACLPAGVMMAPVLVGAVWHIDPDVYRNMLSFRALE